MAVKGRGIAVLAVLGVLVAATMLVGCGSDSGSNASATDEAAVPLSKAQFVKQAEEICKRGVKKKDEAVSAGLKELAATAQGAPTAQESAKLVEEAVLPSYSDTVDQLSQLGAPKADEAKLEKLIGEYEKALKTVEADPAQAAKSNPFASADEAAKAYGLEECRL
ncbi:MAG TPA: hypothetical protein VLC07_06320 [Solirubrobacterales bacterium]|nr:hypothetical protein [Solirubrobacterales bacterium]